MKKSLYLYNPPMLLGGAEILFARLADKAACMGADVTIVDTKSGIYKELIRSDRIKYEIIDGGPKRNPMKLGEQTIIITTTLLIPHLHRFFDMTSDVRIVYWSIHPCHLLRSLPIINSRLFRSLSLTRLVQTMFYRFELQAIRNTLKDGLKKKSLVLMDGENRRVNENIFQVDLKYAKYLPIPSDGIIPFQKRKLLGANHATIAWFGRLCDFKVHSLIKILNDVNLLVLEDKYTVAEFLIVGDGPERKRLEQFSKNLRYKCSFLGEIDPKQMDEIFQSVDIAFAMGTSALDLGVRSIPVCLVDASYSRISDKYRYRWLFETKDFNLGSVVNYEFGGPAENTHLMEDIFSQLHRNFDVISQNTYKYVVFNHDLGAIAQDLLQITETAEQKLSDDTIREAQKRGFFSLFLRGLRQLLKRPGLPAWLQD